MNNQLDRLLMGGPFFICHIFLPILFNNVSQKNQLKVNVDIYKKWILLFCFFENVCRFKKKIITLQPIMFWYHVTISYN